MSSQVPAVIAKIVSQTQKLTYGENQIANFVIHNPEFITRNTITAIANEIGVSETSINRFCKKVGFKGFNDFKIAFAQDAFYRDMQAKKKERREINVIDALALDYNELIVNTSALITEDQLHQVVKLLKGARRILLIGLFDSFLAAMALKNRLAIIGVHADAINDSREMKIAASQCGPEDVVIAFSRSGSTREIIDAVNIAQVNQAKTVAVTCYDSSAITENAVVDIIAPDKISVNNSAFMSNHITFLFVVDLIMSVFISSDKQYLKKKLDSEGILASDQSITNYFL
ncbi:MurR/RpiR family transcriptional regulator [Paenibacillus sp. FSL W8-0187]|jgi:DNA-binding MurR/RpiR family transcriptional regulator|uniref:RpiR family transcriptional regulator n=1 Tax=Paenibacillus lautus TaxID=1401 RepID=A0A1R1B7L1_PAELA|nr:MULTISPECIES: MurR/RpiR family transcriptional regulator [Paenibacillus]MBU5350346.1 MurR/RpiR family transcriptional regulator [Paenibacillus lautus]OME96109.1 RpiR family transcriptional regulator [Paenibacillus lautus]GIO98118.1 putative HTH-type transcriptional regulator [Paenibacillus lautus]